MITSFKLGFSHRISQRVKEEIDRAKKNEIKDETGKALILAPVYEKAAKEAKRFLRDQGIHLRSRNTRNSVSDQAAFNSGKEAANNISLRANGITSDGGKRLQIGG